MVKMKTKYPFESAFEEIKKDPGAFAEAVFACLESDFMQMPKGAGFVEYPIFERGYEKLKQATGGFEDLSPNTILPVAFSEPISVIVLRAMLGFTPPEWAYVTDRKSTRLNSSHYS